jgi:hypothetical protein
MSCGQKIKSNNLLEYISKKLDEMDDKELEKFFNKDKIQKIYDSLVSLENANKTKNMNKDINKQIKQIVNSGQNLNHEKTAEIVIIFMFKNMENI